jgi:hypothetical protein
MFKMFYVKRKNYDSNVLCKTKQVHVSNVLCWVGGFSWILNVGTLLGYRAVPVYHMCRGNGTTLLRASTSTVERGSGFILNQCFGSGCGSGSRQAKIVHKKRKKRRIFTYQIFYVKRRNFMFQMFYVGVPYPYMTIFGHKNYLLHN